MSLVRISQFYVLTGFLALFAFAGDIVADAIADARGEHCVSQTSPADSHHDKTPCSHCSCAIHNGAVATTASAVHVSRAIEAALFFVVSNESKPVQMPVAIDRPPQLA
jgi:hypothetical protein